MDVVTSVLEVRNLRWKNPDIQWGLVPTMGFLHEGHLSLVRQAVAENDRVGVSIFVNPTQFNNPDDLSAYPADLDRDLALLKSEGVTLVWTPAIEEVYPDGFQTSIEVERLSKPLEGRMRPGHFRGVATVVAKLFNVFQPQRAYFGQKDAQQVAVIKQMVRDLNFNLDVIICPTAREADGLAMSSRNVRLSPEARKKATCLYQALSAADEHFKKGTRRISDLKEVINQILLFVEAIKVEYISIADPETLKELEVIEEKALISMAVDVEGVRLIDNLVVGDS